MINLKLSKFFEQELVPGDSVLIGLIKSAACMEFVIAKVTTHPDNQSIALLPLSNGYDIFIKWLPRGATLNDFMKAHDRYMECDDTFGRIKSIKSGTIIADKFGKLFLIYRRNANTWTRMPTNSPCGAYNIICCDETLDKQHAIELLGDLEYYDTCDIKIER